MDSAYRPVRTPGRGTLEAPAPESPRETAVLVTSDSAGRETPPSNDTDNSADGTTLPSPVTSPAASSPKLKHLSSALEAASWAPRGAAASASAAPRPPAKLAHLDGMRGLAALWVLYIHHLGGVLPELQEFVLGYQKWSASVPIFFILSGRVLTASVLRSREYRQLLSCMIRRPFRLYLPLISTMIFDMMTMNKKEVRNLWDIFIDPIWFLFDDGGFPRLTGITWTIHHEFLWSNLQYTFTFVLLALGDNHKARYLVLVGSLVWFQLTHSWMTHFLAGLLLADLAQHGLIKRYQAWRFSPLVTAVVMLAGAGVVVRYDKWNIADWLDESIRARLFSHGHQGVGTNFWEENCIIFLFSFAVMFVLETSTWMQAVFSLAPLRFLGHISFTLYLIHEYVISMFEPWRETLFYELFGRKMFGRLVVVLIEQTVILGLAYLLTPVIDHPSIEFGRWFERVVVMEPWSVEGSVRWLLAAPRRIEAWARGKMRQAADAAHSTAAFGTMLLSAAGSGAKKSK